MNKSFLSVLASALTLSFVIITPALAVSSNSNSRGQQNRQSPTASPSAAVKMTACEAKQDGVKTRMGQLTKLVTDMQTHFDGIANRIMSYYKETVLPSGKSLANYDTLVNDISAKKTLVQTALAKASADVDAFQCATGNPRTYMNQFRLNMQITKTALKNYRTSIKNLLVAVSKISGDLAKPTVTETN